MFTHELTRSYAIRSILYVELLLLVPLVGSLASDDWNWSLLDFILAAITLAIIRGGMLMFVAGIKKHKTPFVIGGLALAIITLLTWIELAVGLFGSPIAGN
jgi:hypothetical protein